MPTIDLKTQALVVIEAMAEEAICPSQKQIESYKLLHGEFNPASAEYYYKQMLYKTAVIEQLYSFAHCVLPTTCKHPTWKDEVKALFKHLTNPKTNYVDKKRFYKK